MLLLCGAGCVAHPVRLMTGPAHLDEAREHDDQHDVQEQVPEQGRLGAAARRHINLPVRSYAYYQSIFYQSG